MYEVGGVCYADLPSAAAARCAGLPDSIAVLADGSLRYTYCARGEADGSLVIEAQVTPASGAAFTAELGQPVPAYPACLQPAVVDAGLTIAGALLSAFAAVWGLWRVYRLVDGYRKQGTNE